VVTICSGEDAATARTLAASLWPNEALEGQLAQELPLPWQFARCRAGDRGHGGRGDHLGPEGHVAAISVVFDAGFDRVCLNQVGAGQRGFFECCNWVLAPGSATE
jgi:hypothetical protein